MRKGMLLVALWSAFLMSFLGLAKADTVALQSITGGTLAASGTDQLYGWIFQVHSPINVTSLGVFDSGGDGLAISHDVGIFRQSSQALLGSTTIPAGVGGSLNANFRYQSVVSFLLIPDIYVIAMTMPVGNDDRQLVIATGHSTAAEISWITSAFDEGSSLAFPSPVFNGAFAQGMFGPNFTFAAAAVPEPSSLLLLGIGLLGLGGRVRRKQSS